MDKWLYTLLIFLGGLLFAAILPPQQTADEATHLIRGIQLARGEIRGKITETAMGCQIPSSVVTDLRSYRGMIGQPAVGMDRKTWRTLYDQCGGIRGGDKDVFAPCQFEHYAPIAHLPVAAAVAAGQIVNLKTVTVLYLGRMVNLLAACMVMLVVFGLLESRPRVQFILFALAAAPANLSLFASLSADPTTVVSAFVVFALAVRLKDQWTEPTFWTFVGAAALLGLCKNVYFPLAALAFPAIWARPESLRKRLGRIALVTGAAIVPLGLWTLYIRDFMSKTAIAGSKAAPGGQLQVITQSPLEYAGMWIGYIWRDLAYLRRSVIGHMGWDNSIPVWVCESYFVGIALIAAVGQRDSAERRFAWFEVLWRLMLCVTVAFLIYSALFVMTGRGMVRRTQGRYYMPLLPLIFASLPIVIHVSAKAFTRWRFAVLLLWCTAIIFSAAEVTGRYWGKARASYWIGEMAMTHRAENGRRAAFGRRENGDYILQTASTTKFDLHLPATGPVAAMIEFGMTNGAWKGSNATDGMEFAVSAIRPGRRPEVIWSRRLNPREVAGDRGPQTARIEIPSDATSLSFATSPGPAGDTRWDWGYWRRLEFE